MDEAALRGEPAAKGRLASTGAARQQNQRHGASVRPHERSSPGIPATASWCRPGCSSSYSAAAARTGEHEPAFLGFEIEVLGHRLHCHAVYHPGTTDHQTLWAAAIVWGYCTMRSGTGSGY
jgi:hypothetical protein